MCVSVYNLILYNSFVFFADVNNAFIIVTPKRQWICQAKSKEAKVNWLLILDSSKRTTLNGS